MASNRSDKSQFNAETPFVVVLNPGSGGGDGNDQAAIIRDVLDGAGRKHEILVVSRASPIQRLANRAVELARERKAALVAVGGDGTINALVQAALPHDLPFGILAQGTFNYTGRRFGIPEDTRAAVEGLLRARVCPAQVGLVQDRVFLVNACLGFYTQVLHDREDFKERLGRQRWVGLLSGLVSVFRHYRRMNLDVECDGKQRNERTSTLVIGNNRLQLEQIGIDCADVVDSGQLVAIAVQPMRALALLWLAARGLLGRLGEDDKVMSFGFHHLEIRPRGKFRRRSVTVALDGEPVRMRFPLVFRPATQRLQLLVPDGARPEAA